ncbi:MAG: MutS family DNA mismatch repair protein [Gemmatimonadaceae bacterium]
MSAPAAAAPTAGAPPLDPALRAAEETARSQVESRRSDGWSWLRVAIFLAGVLLAVMGLAATDAGASVFALALAGAALLFTAAARAQRRAERRAAWHRAIAAVCVEAVDRRARAWGKLPPTVAPAVPSTHPYAADLGVAAGRASLLRLLGPLGAATGARTAARWLLAPTDLATLRARQAAVAELATRDDFRLELAARARLASAGRSGDIAHFLRWAPAAPWLGARPVLAVARWVVPGLWLGLGLAVGVELLPAAVLTIPLLLGIALLAIAGRATGQLLGRAAPGAATFRVFGEQFARIVGEPLEAPLLRELQAALIDDGVPAAVELHRLRRMLDAAELRYSPMLHAVVNIVVAWDLHVLAALERWQRRAGTRADGWFTALGDTEALASFGGLLRDHPDWSLPELSDDADELVADGLGHPLLPPEQCVRNDVAVGPPGTFLLVTGSNMAGKSTLLRAIGANAVLALAGAPVCARRMRLPLLSLHTSMRVSDDLEAGLSFFMAELVRLTAVVEAARRTHASADGQRVLYLLDEILQGTNSAERQVAARRVLDHLLAAGALGAVSTHDLTLADTPALRAAARAVHFREQLAATPDGPQMTFDYLLRPGPATSANAMKLVELMGLG